MRWDKNNSPAPGGLEGQEITTRRELLTRGVELFSALPVVGLGVSNAFRQRGYATIDATQATNAAAGVGIEGQVLAGTLSDLDAALGSLQDAYRSAYHKSREVEYETTDSNGNKKTETRTEWYWDEEWGVPSHSVVDSWKYFSSSMLDKVSELSRPDLIDLGKLDRLLVKQTHAGSVSQIGGSLLITAGVVAALLHYEETVGLREQRRDTDGLEVERRKQLRRALFKYGAATAATAASVYVAGRIDARLTTGTERMKEAVDSAVNLGEITREAAFSGHFGAAPFAIASKISVFGEQARSTIHNGVRNSQVRQAMDRFAQEATRATSRFSEIFRDSIPQELSDRCKSAIITETISKARSGESRLGEFGVLLEGLAAGAAMTAVIVASEVANNQLSKKEQADT